MASIDIHVIEKYYNELNGYKQKYIPLFSKVSKYCDYGADVFNQGDYEGTNNFIRGEHKKIGGDEIKIQDATAINALDIASNQFYSLLVGDGNFFKLSAVDDDNPPNQEFYDKLKNIVLEQLQKTDFETFLFECINELFVYGNTAFSLKYNKEFQSDNRLYNLQHFHIGSFCFDEGANREVENIYTDILLANNVIVETFKNLPHEFIEMAMERPVEKTKIRYCCIRNRFYQREETLDFRKYKWLGVYYFVDKFKNTIIDIEFYSKKPINIARTQKANSELWGRGVMSKIISVVELLNKINAMSVDAVAKMITTSYGQYAGAKTDRKPLDLWSGKGVNDFEFIDRLNGAPPIFAIPKNISDPRALVEYLRNDLVKQIYNALYIDSLLDTALTASGATATEVMQKMNMKNLMLSRILINFTKEILKPVIDLSVNIATAHLRELNPNLQIPIDIQEKMFYGKDWFKIEWTQGIFKINNRNALQDIQVYMSYITQLAQFEPATLQAVNVYDLLKNIEAKISLDKDYLVERGEYEAIRERQNQLNMMAMAQRQGAA
jgi:hypothetical protein